MPIITASCGQQAQSSVVCCAPPPSVSIKALKLCISRGGQPPGVLVHSGPPRRHTNAPHRTGSVDGARSSDDSCLLVGDEGDGLSISKNPCFIQYLCCCSLLFVGRAPPSKLGGDGLRLQHESSHWPRWEEHSTLGCQYWGARHPPDWSRGRLGHCSSKTE